MSDVDAAERPPNKTIFFQSYPNKENRSQSGLKILVQWSVLGGQGGFERNLTFLWNQEDVEWMIWIPMHFCCCWEYLISKDTETFTSKWNFSFYHLCPSSATQTHFQPMPAAVLWVTGQVSDHTEDFIILSSKSLPHFFSLREGQDMTC